MKKYLLVLLTLVVGLGLFACKDDTQVFVIRAWNTEFQDRFRDYYPGYKETLDNGNDLLEDGTEVKWVIVSNDGGAYQTALDQALRNQSNNSGNDLLDMFLIEADYARKYTDVDGDQ